MHQVIQLVFIEYAAFIHLETELSAVDIPTLPATQKELADMFGVEVERDGDEDGSKKGKGPSKANDKEKEADGGKDGGGDPQVSPKAADGIRGEEGQGCSTAIPPCQDEQKLSKEKRTRDLQKEYKEASMCMAKGKKVDAVNVRQFGESWSRASGFHNEIPPGLFRGQELLPYHTYEWGMKGRSKARNMRNIARLAIFAHEANRYYRLPLLLDSNSAASYIRLKLQNAISPFIKTRLGPNANLWADGLDSNIKALENVYNVEQLLGAILPAQMKADHTKQLQRVAGVISSLKIACSTEEVEENEEDEENGAGQGFLNEDVMVAFLGLLQVWHIPFVQ